MRLAVRVTNLGLTRHHPTGSALQARTVPRLQTGVGTNLSTLLRLSCMSLLFIAVGILARAYVAPPTSGAAFAQFWIGLAVCFVAVVVFAIGPGACTWHRRVALALFGAVLYLPVYLRSPDGPIFTDELMHVQTMRLMRDLETTRVPVTLFPIPGDYPGLELVGLATALLSGLSDGWAARMVALIIHIVIPLLAYDALRATGLGGTAAFLGALIYMANIGYYFFHATFSYESLGVVFFLMVALLAVRLADSRRAADPASWLLMIVVIAALVPTHHMTGLMTVGFLAILALTTALASRVRASVPVILGCLLTGAWWMVWLLFGSSERTINYIVANLTDRLQRISAFLLAGQPSRTLFWNTSTPQAEQVLAMLYPALIACLLALGGFVFGRRLLVRWQAGQHSAAPSVRVPWGPHLLARWRGGRFRTAPALAAQLAFALFGPLLWVATAPLILTSASEMVYRAWPFLFLGVGLHAASGVAACLRRRQWRTPWRVMAFGTAGLILAGGIIVGDHQAGRFRSNEIHAAAGPEALTADLIGAATWLNGTKGPLHTVVGDSSSRLAFAVYGTQRTGLWESWVPFYLLDRPRTQAFLDERDVDFVAVDLRDSRYLPRYGQYFSSAELLAREGAADGPTQTLPLPLLAKFDLMPGLDRIYDTGDVIVYANRRPDATKDRDRSGAPRGALRASEVEASANEIVPLPGLSASAPGRMVAPLVTPP